MGIKGFDERLTNARKEKGYTQEELSVKLGVTPQAVSKWERGMGYPDPETLLYLSEILDCSVDYLLHRERKKDRLTENGDDAQKKLLLNNILAEPVVVEAGSGLIPLLEQENRSQFNSIRNLRMKLATNYGILLPVIRVRDNVELGKQEYTISVYDKLIYTAAAEGEKFSFSDICNSLETVCIENYDKIMNHQMVQTLLDNVEEKYPAVVKGIIPDKISLALIQKVLAGILKRNKTIRNLVKIIELLEEEVLHTRDAEELTELIVHKI